MKVTNRYRPIGQLRTCFTEKFGVPRQSMMVQEARAVLEFGPDFRFPQALKNIEEFSHIWIIFVFHKHFEKGWKATIRPPRLDAPRKVGVFASRSPHRPNPIGISAVRLERVEVDPKRGTFLHLSGADFLDQTPVLDIKPYLPYADLVSGANGGWATGQIRRYPVQFSKQSLKTLEKYRHHHSNLQKLIHEMLEWDPRPTSQRRAMPIEAPETQGMSFAFRLYDFDVKWKVQNSQIEVLDLKTLD